MNKLTLSRITNTLGAFALIFLSAFYVYCGIKNIVLCFIAIYPYESSVIYFSGQVLLSLINFWIVYYFWFPAIIRRIKEQRTLISVVSVVNDLRNSEVKDIFIRSLSVDMLSRNRGWIIDSEFIREVVGRHDLSKGISDMLSAELSLEFKRKLEKLISNKSSAKKGRSEKGRFYYGCK